MSFAERAPSTTWEPIPLPAEPPATVWAWFKPAAGPNSVVLQLPPELWPAGVAVRPLTIRMLAGATGIPALIGWTLYGQQLPLNDQTANWLDAQLPPPPAGGNAQLILWTPMLGVPTVPQAYAEPMTAAADSTQPEEVPRAGDLMPGENPGPYFELIDFYWTNIQYLESEIRRARGQLEQAISRINSFNRDLNPEENHASDSVDRQQWTDARRGLRDAASGISRSMKEIDVGLLSGAGQRNRFLTILETYIQPRIPFPGLKQAAVDFEMHHKSAKNILQAAQTAIHKGTSDGERRANAVLQRIHQKARKASQQRGKK